MNQHDNTPAAKDGTYKSNRHAEIEAAEAVSITSNRAAAEAINDLGWVGLTKADLEDSEGNTRWELLKNTTVMIVSGDGESDWVASFVKEVKRNSQGTCPLVQELRDCWPDMPMGAHVPEWRSEFPTKEPQWFRRRLHQITKPPAKKNRAAKAPVPKRPPVTRTPSAYEAQLPNVIAGDGDAMSPREEEATVTTNSHMEWQPFPLQTLSGRFRAMVDAVARCVGVDPAMVVLPMLSVASTAIGNSRSIETKQNTTQPLMLWPIVIAPSGAQKSAPFEFAEQPLAVRNELLTEQHGQACVEYEQDFERYKSDLTEWKNSDRNEAPPVKPASPPKGRLMVVDFTLEALVECHAGHPRCIHVSGEEFGAVFGMMDRYGDGKSAKDLFQLLRSYDGRSLTNDRVGRSRVCPRAFLQLNGASQPNTFRKCLTDTARSSGFAARLWPVMPPVKAIRWTDDVVSDQVIAGWDSLVGDLFSLPPVEGESSWPKAEVMQLTPAARALFGEWMNDCGRYAFDGADDDDTSASVKWIGRCARLAGILHCIGHVEGTEPDALLVEAHTMRKAIEISRWGLRETSRVYAVLQEDEELRKDREHLQWICNRHATGITARELHRGRHRHIKDSEEAERILTRLTKRELGSWSNGSRTRQFIPAR